MQINSFRAFFKLILGKFSLSIYLRGVKIAHCYPGMLTCDSVSSGSDQLSQDDCSFFLFFLMFKFIFRLPNVRKFNKQPKTCPFFCFCKKVTCVRYLSSFTVFASDTVLVAKCFNYVLMQYVVGLCSVLFEFLLSCSVMQETCMVQILCVFFMNERLCCICFYGN